jgi:hypothetical protein
VFKAKASARQTAAFPTMDLARTMTAPIQEMEAWNVQKLSVYTKSSEHQVLCNTEKQVKDSLMLDPHQSTRGVPYLKSWA